MPRTKPFNEHPYKYEKWFIKNTYAYESELLAVKKHLPKEGVECEIGVGSGRFAAPLGIRIGVEPSRKMRMICKKKIETLIDSIGESLPFKNTVFDYVLMVTTICFIDDIEGSFKEIYRTLKKEGELIIGFIDRNYFSSSPSYKGNGTNRRRIR
ncbi:MAG: class I SAM-dependent methyltransferase [Promethearchaeia archaeon]